MSTVERLAERLRREGEPWPGAPAPEIIAAALLPGVRELQAEELEAAAEGVPRFSPQVIAQWLRQRAASLRATR